MKRYITHITDAGGDEPIRIEIDSRDGLGYIPTGWYIVVPPGGTRSLRRLQVPFTECRGRDTTF
jgi:hypothetical protein